MLIIDKNLSVLVLLGSWEKTYSSEHTSFKLGKCERQQQKGNRAFDIFSIKDKRETLRVA